jgi:transaldolase
VTNPIQQLREIGQSIWLDNITRDLLTSGGLRRYRDEFAVTGLTSNPTIFDHAIGNSTAYDQDIQQKAKAGKRGEDLFFELALADLRHAADLFRPIYDATNGVDGWVSLEVSPLIATDAASTVSAAQQLHERAARPNVFIKIPGTLEGITAIEESIFAGVPINVTLLFSREQYLAAAEAYLRAIERRLAAGLKPDVHSVASVFISRWDKAVMDKVPEAVRDRLGIAVAQQTYKAYRDLLNSPRWRKLASAGTPVQRLLWASTGTKDPLAPDVLYLDALAAPDTITTVPEATLKAFADHGAIDAPLPPDGGDVDAELASFEGIGVDVAALAKELQQEGMHTFDVAWSELLQRIVDKSNTLANVA